VISFSDPAVALKGSSWVQVGGQSTVAVVQAGRGGAGGGRRCQRRFPVGMSDLPGMMRDPVGVRLVPVRVPGLLGQHIALTTFLLNERWRRSGASVQTRASSAVAHGPTAWSSRLIHRWRNAGRDG
jgi:hypothetical protein